LASDLYLRDTSWVKQFQALDILKLGHSVFLTGAPGAGKTFVLNQFIDHLHEHDINVGITASTGIAATHIGGSTIHSWSGIGIKDDLDDMALSKLINKSSHKSRLKFVRVLIIDEISMLDGARMDLLNKLLKRAKSSNKPFGGVQVVMTGDLFQLPPVSKNSEPDFPHLSNAWRELNPVICYLSEQHRAEDPQLLDILDAMRKQELEEAHFSTLQEQQTEHTDTAITKLYTHNMDVDQINHRELKKIDNEEQLFSMQGSGREPLVEVLAKGCLAPEALVLKKGAEVLFVANKPANGYFNGTRGEVIGFDDGKPVVKIHNSGRDVTVERASWQVKDGDKVLAEITQFPLRLAWAITVHKSQGMSLDAAEIDLSKAFTPGMGYVAISRVRTLDGLKLKGLNNMAMRVHPGVAEFDKKLQERSNHAIDSLSNFKKSKLKKAHQAVAANLSLDYPNYDKDLFAKFKDWRTAQAKKQSIPPYMVLSDKSLYALSAEKPQTLAKLTTIPGIGAVKRDQYAEDLLTLINQASGKLL